MSGWFVLILLLPAAPAAEEPVTTRPARPVSRRQPRTLRDRNLKRVTLDFEDADLVSVVKTLAKEMGRNVYIGPGVEGSVAFSLRDVPVYAALDLILKAQEKDIAYKLVGYNTLVVASPEKVNQIEEEIYGKSFIPKAPVNSVRQEILLEKGAPAAKVIGLLQGQYHNVEFIPHPTLNGFYAVGSRADVLAIKNDVPNLDRVPEGPGPPVREFVRVRSGDPNEVRSLLAALMPDLTLSVDARQSTLTLEGTPGAVEQAKELLEWPDPPLNQVVLECKLVPVTAVGHRKLGIVWSDRTVEGDWINETEVTALPAPRLKLGTTGRTDLGFQANLNYLVSQSEARVLASPRVGVVSGTEGQIHIGDRFPIVAFEPATGEFRREVINVGIKLDITATKKSDDHVVCKILIEVSTLLELINQQLPVVRVRRFETEANIKDGETLVLGGLLDARDLQAARSLPLLGDLPILGSLFRRADQGDETVLMITPQVMK